MTDQGGPGGLRVKQRQQVPVGVRRRQQETGRLRGTQRIHTWKTVSFISALICSYLATSFLCIHVLMFSSFPTKERQLRFSAQSF